MLSKYAMSIYGANLQRSTVHQVKEFNYEHGIYQIVTPYDIYSIGRGHHSHEINIVARTCGCGKLQNQKIPCSHAIKLLLFPMQDPTSYIDPCYSLDNVIRTYSHAFVVPK